MYLSGNNGQETALQRLLSIFATFGLKTTFQQLLQQIVP